MRTEDAGSIRHAGALCAQGSFAEALELLRPLVDSDPHNDEAWSLLAWAELGAEHDESAVDAAEHATRLDPEAGFTQQIAAAALLRLRRPGEAAAHARRAVQIDPFDWRALGLLARALTRDGSDTGETQELVTRMVALAPEEPEAHLIAGSVAAAAGNGEDARTSFRRVLQLDPASGAAQHELARLRLKRRANDPAALADATAGFARAARAEPDQKRSLHSMEAVLRLFLAKTAYLLLIDAYLVGRVAATSGTVAARVLAPALLVIPAFYAWRFVGGLTPPLRRHLRALLTRKRTLRIAAWLEAISVLAILAAAVLAQSARSGAAGVAAVTALLGRILLYTQLEHASRAAQGRPARPAISSGVLLILAGLLGLIAVALVVAALKDGGGPAAALIAVLVAAGAAALIGIVTRRRTGGLR